MKRALSMLLALCILLLLPGCFGPKQAAEAIRAAQEAANTPKPFLPDISEVIEEASQDTAEAESPAGGITAPAGAMTPADAYAKYAGAKSSAYDRINAKLEEHQELYLSVGMALFPVAMIDLSLIPLTVVGLDDAGMALSMLGIANVAVDKSGDTYSVAYKDDQGRTVALTCEYDPASDSMRSISTRDGQELLLFEYARSGDGYASQYYVWDEESKDYSWITGFFNETDIAAFGVSTVAQKQASIFKGKGLTKDFVINKDGYFILEGDKLTVLENGQAKTY